jgi:DNA repair exonuclease SbcCD ATPase subunit
MAHACRIAFKNAAMSTIKSIEELIERFDAELTVLTNKLKNTTQGRIVIGINRSQFRNSKRMITQHLDDLNAAFETYQRIYHVPDKSEEAIADILNCFQLQPAALDLELKKRHIAQQGVKIQQFSAKPEKLVELYDFPSDVLELILNLEAQIGRFADSKKKTDLNYLDYYDKRKDRFGMSAEQESDLLESLTVYGTIEDLDELLSLHLFARSLTQLSEYYQIEGLPELDRNLIKMFNINSAGVQVDLSKVKEAFGGPSLALGDSSLDIRVVRKPD